MNNTELSIQIDLGGFSFSLRESACEIYSAKVEGFDFSVVGSVVPAGCIVDSVTVWCATARATVIPAEIYDPAMVSKYLEALNLLAIGDVALSVAVVDKVVVWAVGRSIVEQVQALWPCCVWIHAQAGLLVSTARQSIKVFVTAAVAHIAVFDQNGGVFAVRSVDFVGAVDVLFCVRQMAVCDVYSVYSVGISGDESGVVSELFSRYYNNLSVVADPLFLLRR